jgi:hypothetical protein
MALLPPELNPMRQAGSNQTRAVENRESDTLNFSNISFPTVYQQVNTGYLL